MECEGPQSEGKIDLAGKFIVPDSNAFGHSFRYNFSLSLDFSLLYYAVFS